MVANCKQNRNKTIARMVFGRAAFCFSFIVLFSLHSFGQMKLNDPNVRYKISGGSLQEVKKDTTSKRTPLIETDGQFTTEDAQNLSSVLAAAKADSTAAAKSGLLAIDSLTQDTVFLSGGGVLVGEGLGKTVADTEEGIEPLEEQKQQAAAEFGEGVELAPGEAKKLAKEQAKAEKLAADSAHVRHNWLFRDSVPISRLTLYSMAVPGLSQVYNNQAWKIPVMYTALGTSILLTVRQQSKYNQYRKTYRSLKFSLPETADKQSLLDPSQRKMIEHNTYRQIFLFGAIASYIYIVGDGVVNYPGAMSDVKKATTLSTICPGAGQVYNGKFWKLPIVVGGLATMAYTIDWNNRGYQRFKDAYNMKSAQGDTYTGDLAAYPLDFLRNTKNNYRRNRDLCIILTGAFYLLNIIDAHVDAHLRDYDVSDDLALDVQPFVNQFYASGKSHLNMGLSFNFKF